MISGLIFDMDGVIFDTEKMLAHFWNKAALEFGYDMNISHSIAIRSTAPKKAEEILKGFFGDEFDYYAVRERRRKLMNEYIDKNGLPVKDGVFKILKMAKKNNLKTSIATATDIERTKWYLEKENLTDYFDTVSTTQMVERGKPYPDIYQYACMSIGLSPLRCAAFEDSDNGIKSACNAGCKVFVIPDLTQPDDEIKKMAFRVENNLSKASDYIENVILKSERMN